MPSVSAQYSTCTAKASFSSHRPMSSTVRPAFCSSFGTAYTGPMPISSGSQPATAKPRNTPSGASPFASAMRRLITIDTEAPSENWLALPAVTTPPGSAVRIFATPSSVVSARMPSSAPIVTSRVSRRPDALSATPITVVIGTISASKRPSRWAAAARSWLCTP